MDVAEKRLSPLAEAEYIVPICKQVDDMTAVDDAVVETPDSLAADECSASGEAHDSPTPSVDEE